MGQDSFTVIKDLKKGGQKSVSLIQSEKYGRAVLKVGKCESQTSLERIIREVDMLRDIDSPYFPKNYEFTYDNQGNFKIFEEYIESDNLSDCAGLFNTESTIVNLALEIIEGMHLLWDKRIVHRDLKPDNILVKKNRHPVIIDLGIARDLQGKSLTLTFLHRGPCTPVYSSPEQLKNQKDAIDIRTDFFAIGIIMAELFLGVHPFHPDLVGSGLSIVENIESGNYKLQTSEKKMTPLFYAIVEKLLGMKPYNRFRTYQSFRDDLLKIQI